MKSPLFEKSKQHGEGAMLRMERCRSCAALVFLSNSLIYSPNHDTRCHFWTQKKIFRDAKAGERQPKPTCKQTDED